MTQTNLTHSSGQSPKQLLSAQDGELQQMSHRLVNVVIIVLTVVAFLPAFIDQSFYASMPRFISSIVLGVLYGLVGTSHFLENGRFSRKTIVLIYYILQFAIITVLFVLGKTHNHNYWILMLPLAAQGTEMGWKGAAGISILLLGLFWGVYWFNQPPETFLNSLLSIATAMLFTIMFTVIAFREQAARVEIERLAHDLQGANHRLAEYAAQVEELATMKERNRLARDIHDNLGHYLTVVNIQIEAARIMLDHNPTKAQDALIKAQKLTQDGLSSVRQSVSSLRESPLEQRPLTEAIVKLVEENEATGIYTQLVVENLPTLLSPQIKLTLYRAVQEALTNVRKHARASQVTISLSGESEELVQLTVQDNGVGSQKADGGFGILGIQERVQLLNGTMTTQTAPGKGFEMTIRIPHSPTMKG